MNNIKPQGRSRTGYFIFHILSLLLVGTSGCGNKFFNPKEVGRFNHTAGVTNILETLGVAEEKPLAWEQGDDPRPIDTVANTSDYTLMSGDIIRIFIYELLGQGLTYSEDFEVTETGKISIPEVGVLNVKGKTETQLESMIKNELTPDTLVNPLVHVTLIQSQQRTYSIQGDGVRMPSRYQIPRYEWRLQDALALAGGASQKNVSYIYVTRKTQKNEVKTKTSKNNLEDFRAIQSAYNLKEPVTPDSIQQKRDISDYPIGKIVVSSSEMVIDRDTNRNSRNYSPGRNRTAGRLGGRNTYQLSDMPNGEIENPVSIDEVLKRVTGRSDSANRIEEKPPKEEPREEPRVEPREEPVIKPREEETDTTEENGSHVEWIFQNGTWVPVEVESPGGKGIIPKTQEIEEIPSKESEIPGEPIDWELRNGKWVPVKSGSPAEKITKPPVKEVPVKIEEELIWIEPPTEARLIKIPIDKLIAGDPRYNIVIKPGDSIVVPLDVAGVYYLMGNLNRTGAVEMTGGMVTLKQAIATAGNLGELAWPRRCEIVRRTSRNQQITVRVDLEKIFSGEQPDIYIKPQDIINVGTHATAIWRAVLRNSFRAAYGFGFAYDRNFADKDFYTSRPFSMF